MSERIFETIRVEPLIANSNTAAATSPRKIRWSADDYRMLFVCKMQGAPVTGTALSATVAQLSEFKLTEATASTHAGSVITGATLTLGCATAYKPRSADAMVIVLTSVIGSAASFTVNGQSFHATDVGTGTSGEGCASFLAHAINGGGTQEKLKHYSAVGNFTDTGIVLIYPDDGLGTGLSCTAANATDFKTRPLSYTGCIELRAESLSTHYPKFIGVTISTQTNASCERIVDCIRMPSYRPGWSGKSTVV